MQTLTATTSTNSDYQLRWLIVITVMITAILEVLDGIIVSVVMPSMMGALGANSNQITWVLTSYVVASAICIPLTGFFDARLGRKRLLILCVSGFMVSSMLCGLATSLDEMIVFRIIQGLSGAMLIPLAQYIIRDTFPKDEQAKAMSVWGIGIMAAPALGPTLGGFIAEHTNWRWIFYLNVPLCMVALVMTFIIIKPTAKQKRPIDWFGLILMIIAISSLQLFLDEGNDHSWWQSHEIVTLALISVVTLTTFIARGIFNPKNIVKIRLFANRNFMLSTVIVTLLAGALFSVISLQPILLERLLNYPVETAGLVMAPRGLASMLAMMLVAPFMRRYGGKPVLIAGTIICCYGTYMMTNFSLDMSMNYIIWSGAIQGFGMGLVFVPTSVYCFATLPQSDNAEASGLFSYGRMLGTSVGISILSTIVTQETQINWNRLGGHITAFSTPLKHWLIAHGLNLHSPTTAPLLSKTLHGQANMVAFINGFLVMAICLLVLIPLILLLQDTPLTRGRVSLCLKKTRS